MRQHRKEKKVYGVGINDADYTIKVNETLGYVDGKQIQRVVWTCPFYKRWVDMLKRCYNSYDLTKNPTYMGCSVCYDWLTFSNFRKWMSSQDWEGKQLDKDILVRGNKVYSPETCVFLPSEVNSFIVETRQSVENWPTGVDFKQSVGKFRARCKEVAGKSKHLGYYDTPEEAHEAWKKEKIIQAKLLASKQTDERVAKALIDRYENFKEKE